jgi:hypothetical protein
MNADESPRPKTMADQIRDELAEVGLSQRAAARQLGIDEREMRRYCSDTSVAPPYVLLALRQLTQIARNDQVIKLLDEGSMSTSDGALTREQFAERNAKLAKAIQFLMRDRTGEEK